MIKKAQRILVADDDPIYREVATEALEKAGQLVTQAKDGGEALAFLAAEKFDAAIVDLSMPVADGLEVIAKLRASEANANIPVIVITGHDDARAVECAYVAGATSFLTKPLNWVLFTPHVEFVLRAGQIEAELRETTAAAAFLSDLKSELMTALAREFQAPIKTILGFSELINKEVYGSISPPNYKDMTFDIGKAAQSLNTALLKLMDFGRTLTDQLSIADQDVNAGEVLRDAIAALEPKATRRDIKITSDIKLPAHIAVKVDKALFSQALRGLLDNAIRMSPRGTEVKVTAELTADNCLSVSTSDFGPEVSPELLLEVNGRSAPQKFIARQIEIHDVGIKIAKVLTEAHQGSMNLRSGYGGPNVVRIELPRERVKVSEGLRITPPAPALEERFAAISSALAQDPRLGNRQLRPNGYGAQLPGPPHNDGARSTHGHEIR